MGVGRAVLLLVEGRGDGFVLAEEGRLSECVSDFVSSLTSCVNLPSAHTEALLITFPLQVNFFITCSFDFFSIIFGPLINCFPVARRPDVRNSSENSSHSNFMARAN